MLTIKISGRLPTLASNLLFTLIMDFHKLATRFNQFGGLRLVWQYAKLGALLGGVKAFFRCLAKKRSFKEIYPEILKKVEPALIAKYEPVMRRKTTEVKGKSLEHQKDKVIWWCWLQGFEAAPPIVKACYASVERHLPDYEIKLIDNINWKEYVKLPGYVVEKWEKGRIPAAMFTDLLRLELLIRYGGTWMDSTVLSTGNINENQNVKYLDANLFLFQYTQQGSLPVSISNWFISACSNNEVLMVQREMLYAYWKDYDCVLDYYIFHLFFSMISKEYPEEIAAMPYGHSMKSLALLHHWGETFDQKKWDRVTSKVSFHKLAFRVSENVKRGKDNYFNHILTMYE